MAGTGSIQERLREGIEAARRGDKAAAQKLLRYVVDRDPDNEVAWMWLASALENLQDRRAALEQSLRINPGNTRAQEALRQIDALLPPSPAARRTAARQTAANLPRVGGEGRPSGTMLIIIGTVIGLIVIVLVIFSIVSSQQPTVPNSATLAVQQAAILNSPTPIPTIDPDTYTATPFLGVFVTRDPADQILPPSFTPTFTPSPSATPLPTETPIPLSLFSVLYTTIKDGQTKPSLYHMTGDGTGDQELEDGTAGFSDIAFAADGQKIAFVRTVTYDKDGTSVTSPELFIANVGNVGAARQISQFGASHLASPTWQADSVQLAFVSNQDGDDEIWYITEDGNNLRQLTQSDGIDKDPAWSPDGSTIVFASERANYQEGKSNGLTELFSMATDGTNVVQLTDDQNSSYSPMWSPDGTQIVFASDRKGDGDIYIMDPTGGGQQLLTFEDNGAEDRKPAFVPIIQSIVFLSNRDGESFQFYVMNSRGQSVMRLADPGLDIQSFSFRPEQKR